MSKISKKEEQLKRAFERAIANTTEGIEKAQNDITTKRDELSALTELVRELSEEKSRLISEYNEFLETLEP